MAEGTAQTIAVEAHIVSVRQDRAPDVLLAFDGTNPPSGMLDDLNQIGWGIPPFPSPPSTAIEWVPDPQTGADHTIKPWKVVEFQISPGAEWVPDNEREIAQQTFAVLARHGVQLFDQAGVPYAREDVVTPEPVVASSDAGALAIVLDSASPGNVDGLSTWTATGGGRRKEQWVWSEGAVSSEQIQTLGDGGAHVWTLVTDPRPQPTAKAAVVQLIAPNAAEAADDIESINRLVGGGAVIVPMQSQTGGPDAALAAVLVPNHSAEMLSSNLRLRLPKMILRLGAAA